MTLLTLLDTPFTRPPLPPVVPPPFVLPDVDDMQLARYGFWTTQARWNAAPTAGTPIYSTVTCEWHGTTVDAERGAFCIVPPGGRLATLVGEWLRVTYGTRSVAVYCHNEADGYSDLSLTRRAFQALELLSVDEIVVRVEVLV